MSHPLWIDEIIAGDFAGLIGITFCPGKHGDSNSGYRWERDLKSDLDVIAGWHANAIVTLIEDYEFKLLQVPDLGAEVRRRGIQWYHLPIVDVGVPDQRFEIAWRSSGPKLVSILRGGGRVLVHCRGAVPEPLPPVCWSNLALHHERQFAAYARGAGERSRPPGKRIMFSICRGHSVQAHKQEDSGMDWFERLMGFRETGYEHTRQKLKVSGRRLRSRVNGQSYGIGEFELVALDDLRQRARQGRRLPGRLKVSVVEGDVRQLHRSSQYAGALFQVASQFNMLEMVGPNVTPEDGVTRYEHDRTQGPACAISAGAATIYRNYFVPVGNQCGQTKARQLDGLSDLGTALSKAIGKPAEALWSMRNGYALCTREGLDAISDLLASLSSDETDTFRGKLRIGVHWDVEVTGVPGANRPTVSQAFCSALPVSYSGVPHQHWPAFASLVLDAAYEATMWAGVCNAQRGVSNMVLLTRLGGGAFGNDDHWIDGAMRRGLQLAASFNLDVKIVSYNRPSQAVLRIAEEFR